MIVLLNGTSSTGKSSVAELFPKKFKRIALDSYYTICMHRAMGHMPNKYVSIDDELTEAGYKCMANEAKRAKYAVIDTVDLTSEILDYLPKSTVSILLYASPAQLVKNIHSRRGTNTRFPVGVLFQYAKLYTMTTNKDESIDTISRDILLTALNKVKWGFDSALNMKRFVKHILSLIGITDSKKYMIKAKSTAHVIHTDGKSIRAIYDEIKQMVRRPVKATR